MANPAPCTGCIAVIGRGGCPFTDKVRRVQLAGAVAAVTPLLVRIHFIIVTIRRTGLVDLLFDVLATALSWPMPLSSQHGTYKTVKARFWPCLLGKGP